MQIVGKQPYRYIPAGEVSMVSQGSPGSLVRSCGTIPWGPPQPDRGMHKGHKDSTIWNQDWDFAQYLARMGRIDKRAETERDRRELEKAKEEAEKKLGGRHFKVPVEKRSLRAARDTLLRTAPLLEGPRLSDLGTEAKLKEILKDRQEFHAFEEQVRLSLDKALFYKRAQTAQETVNHMIESQRNATIPAAHRRGSRIDCRPPAAMRKSPQLRIAAMNPITALSHNALVYSGKKLPEEPRGQSLGVWA